jgi:hypothetical protein
VALVATVLFGLAGPRSAAPRDGAAPGALQQARPPAVPSAADPTRRSVAAGADPRVTERAGALTVILDRRAAALRRRDRAAWLSDVDPTAVAFRERQARAFATLRAVPIAAWRYTVEGAGAALPPGRAAALGAEAGVLRVVLRYRIAGFDARDVEREQQLTVARRAGRWVLAGDTDAGSAAVADRDLWDVGAARVVRGERTLVIGTGPLLERYAREGDSAARRVARLWRAPWPRRLIVLVPATSGQLLAVLGRPSAAGLGQIAALTTGRTRGDGIVYGDRVVINPATYPTLSSRAREIVMAHETTHVATRAAARTPVPIWLSEGFADYVGYRDARVPVSIAAGDLIARVRSGRLPAALPDDADFDAARGEVSYAYNGAWLACRLIAQRHGERALASVYEQAAVAGRPGLAAALARLGTDERRLTADWRAHLLELAG